MSKLESGSIDMVLTDLPYGVTARNNWDKIIDLDRMWEHFKRVAKANTAFVFTATQPFASSLIQSNPDWFKYDMIWRKQQGTGFLNAKKQPLRNHESILVFYKQQPTYNPQFTEGTPYTCKSGRASLNYREQVSVVTENDGKRYPLTVIDFPYDKKKIHPTQKPVDLFRYLIRMFTNPDDTILDCCAGSGTTHIAAYLETRNSICIEKDEKVYKDALIRIKEEASSNETEMVNNAD